MLKVYEWLVYIIMSPHKSFQHLIKWFGIFIRAKTNYRKQKGKIKQKNSEKLTCRSSEAGPPQPSRPRGARGSSSPSRASKLLGGMPPSKPGTTHRRRVLPGLPVASSRAWRRRSSVCIHSPPPELPPPPPVNDFVTTRERRRSPSKE